MTERSHDPVVSVRHAVSDGHATRRHRPAARDGRPAQRAVRGAAARRGHRRRRRRVARHDAERRPPAPRRARRRRPRGDGPGDSRSPGQQGRTEQVYRVASAAESLFPRAYGELTNQLLAYVPPGAVTAAFEHRRDDRIDGARARLATVRGFRAKVAELARILDEDGYLASVEPIGRERVPHRRAQLRHLRRRQRPPAGLLDGARVPARRAARGGHRARHPHDDRRPLVQLRGPQAAVTTERASDRARLAMVTPTVRRRIGGCTMTTSRRSRRWLAAHWDPALTVGAWWELLGDAGWAAPSLPVGRGGRDASPDDAAAIATRIVGTRRPARSRWSRPVRRRAGARRPPRRRRRRRRAAPDRHRPRRVVPAVQRTGRRHRPRQPDDRGDP